MAFFCTSFGCCFYHFCCCCFLLKRSVLFLFQFSCIFSLRHLFLLQFDSVIFICYFFLLCHVLLLQFSISHCILFILQFMRLMKFYFPSFQLFICAVHRCNTDFCVIRWCCCCLPLPSNCKYEPACTVRVTMLLVHNIFFSSLACVACNRRKFSTSFLIFAEFFLMLCISFCFFFHNTVDIGIR